MNNDELKTLQRDLIQHSAELANELGITEEQRIAARIERLSKSEDPVMQEIAKRAAAYIAADAEDPAERDREEFLEYCRQMINYWANLPELYTATGHKHTTESRISGCVFSILVALDGGASVGPYCVKRVLADGQTGEQLGEGPDIAGCLHELLKYPV